MIGTGVLRQRERAGVDDRRSSLRINADDCREHRHGDVVDRARSDRRLKRVVENVVAGTHFIAVGELVDDRRRRRRADAADDLVNAEQRAESRQRRRLLRGDVADVVGVRRVIRVAGVRQQSLKSHRLRSRDRPRELFAVGIVGIDAGAVIAAVDFQKDIKCMPRRFDRA